MGKAEEGKNELEDEMKQVSQVYQQKSIVGMTEVLTVLLPEPVRPTTATR